MLADGRILVGVSQIVSATQQVGYLLRSTAAGALDTSFGTQGRLTLSGVDISGVWQASDGHLHVWADTATESFAIELDAAGAILATSPRLVNPYATVVHFTIAGTSDGRTSETGQSEYTSLAPLPGGGFVAAGGAGSPTLTNVDTLLTWHQANGALDTAFGQSGSGRSLINHNANNDSAQSVVVQPDGKVVAVVNVSAGGVAQDVVVARYLTNGTLDPTFADAGKLSYTAEIGAPPSREILFEQVALDAQGRILVSCSGGPSDWSVMRLTP